jgi:hypothetical protein
MTAPAVGWKFITWTLPAPVRCNVGSCDRPVKAGHVRVDNVDPRAERFVVLCVDCYGLIMAGVDPDPAAAVPEWEQKNREIRLRGITDA